MMNLPLTIRKLVWQDRLETLWINLSEKIIIKNSINTCKLSILYIH